MSPIVCQVCKKNMATVHLTEIIKNKKREIHLCEECASKKGVAFKTQQFSISDLLSGLVNTQAAQEIDPCIPIIPANPFGQRGFPRASRRRSIPKGGQNGPRPHVSR